MKLQSIKFKGVNVSFSDQGKGKTIVFLHGFLENQFIWKYYAKELANSTTRVVTIDLLGHGSTSCLSYVHTMEEMAEAVECVLQHLKIRKAFFVGHSLGGYVSLAFAEKNPDMLRGLCMFHSTARGDSKEKQKDRDRAIKVVKRNKSLFVNEAIPNLFNTEHKPFKRAIKKISQMANETSVQGVVAALEGMKIRLDREIVLNFAPYPVLFIVGKKDNILPYEVLIEQSKICENGSYLLLEKVGHAGFEESKDVCLKALKSFTK